ncbi:hypothetical protein M8J76_016651 [Diaphorina citri]|nr:hypothetical protein M8J76_016651 [Diaphorina citri]
MSKVPIFVILGSTGTGKSKLGIEIAKKFNGEIISADSMQVYKGLDVITNKVTPEEAEGIPHHLLDFLDPNTRFTVVDYRNRALKHIDDILQRNKVPIIVGGTNYYIESLLWTILLDNKTNINEQGEFTLYDMDKIRNLEHGRDVLESLWKLDKEEKDDLFKVHNTDKIDELEGENDKRDNKREDLFKVHNAGKIDELEGGNDKRDNENLFKMESNDKIDEQGAVKDHQTKMEIPATDAGDKMDGKGVKDQTERSATEMFRDKRKHKDNLDVEESAKRIKTDGDESKAQTELESSQDGLKGSGKLISKETRSQKVVETENSGNTTQKCDRQLEQLENSKQNADQLTTESKCQQTTHASHDLKDQPNSGKSTSSKSANIIESTSSNREGIKALVNVLDTLRGKMITDIEQANRFSLGYRTLKDIMAPTKEENAYEKTDFQCTNVKKMFENLNEKFEQFKEVNGQNVGDTESLRTDEYVSKEIVDNKADQNEDPFLQTTTTLFSDYRSSCTKLLEQFKHQTLLPKQFLYCVSIHQKSKPFGEKLALFGLSGSQLSAHVQSLARTVKELQERLVQFGVAEDGLTNTQSRTGESVTSTEEQLLEGPEAGVQLATLLTQFEQGIGCLNSRIGQKLSESTIDNVAEKDAVTSLLQSATSLIHHLSAQLIPPRPLVTQTKYFLPTDTDRTNLSHANLHSMLQEVDHSTSLNLHPKNRRKVVR